MHCILISLLKHVIIVYLNVEPPPVLHPPVNVTSSPGTVAVLSCHVQGSVRHNLTWYLAGSALSSHSGRVKVLANSSLEINWVRSQDAGPYQCRATNPHGESQAVVWLVVLGILQHLVKHSAPAASWVLPSCVFHYNPTNHSKSTQPARLSPACFE